MSAIVSTIETLPDFPCPICGTAKVNRFRPDLPRTPFGAGAGWWECPDHPATVERIPDHIDASGTAWTGNWIVTERRP